MLDLRDGELIPLSVAMEEFKKSIKAQQEAMQKAMDATGVPRVYQGPVFKIGEIVEVKGGKFRIQNFGHRGRLVLCGLPSGEKV